MASTHDAGSAVRSSPDAAAARTVAGSGAFVVDARDADHAAFPSFAVDDTGLEHTPGAPPGDQPHAPPMRWLKLIKTDSGRITCGVWDCQAGSFDVHFKCDEVVHILEGEVIVHAEGGTHTLGPGDVALFREGLITHWEVPRYVRKLWLHHFRQPTVRERIEYKLRMWTGRLRP